MFLTWTMMDNCLVSLIYIYIDISLLLLHPTQLAKLYSVWPVKFR